MKPEVIMIQPITSLTGSFIRMLPIGLLYATSKIVKDGLPVHILDTRISPSTWEKDLDSLINDHTIVIGITVMSGISILASLKISRHIRNNYPWIKVVWGGPHPTFSPADVLMEPSIDFVIRGYGSEPFNLLLQNLISGENAIPLEGIKGLSWRSDEGDVHHNEISKSFEFIKCMDIPYRLIKNFSNYKHIDNNEIVFPMYSVMGCPYKCAFCSSPATYANFKRKWHPYLVEDVVEHIKMVKERYGATFIYFIDDDSFVDLNHVESIIDEIKRRGIQKIKLGFRGARINEILLMSEKFLKKLVDAGTNTMHVGAESGSDRLLKLMNKNISVEQIIEANKRLSLQPKINIFYNFIVGFPTETLDETKMTRDLILRLVKDNPSCCVIPLNKPRPLPGTDLYALAVNHGYTPPKTLEEWGNYDVESSNYNPEWLSKRHNQFIRMMFICMYFIDNKIFKLSKGNSIRYKLLRILSFIYKPVALFRFKKGLYHFLIEDKLYNLFKRIL